MKKQSLTGGYKAQPLSARLRGVYLENFQSIKGPAYIEMNGLTLLYGPNSAGKSSIIDALKLLRMAFGPEEPKYNNEALWGIYASEKTKLGLSFVVDFLEGPDANQDVDHWFNEELDGLQQHLTFMKNIDGRLIHIEYSGSIQEIKIAIDGRPLLEISSNPGFDYEEDRSLRTEVENDDDYECYDRTFWGQLTFYKGHADLLHSFPRLKDLFEKIVEKEAFLLSVDGNWIRSSYSDASVTSILFSEDDDKFTLKGIYLDKFHGRYSHINVSIGLGLRDYLELRSTKLGLEAALRSSLYHRIQEVANEINLIVAGLCFQVREILDYSHVSGDRKLLGLRQPVYISSELGFLRSGDECNNHPSIGEYARYLVAGDASKTRRDIAQDLVANSFGYLIESLKGYRLKASTLKIRNREDDRLNYFQREIQEGYIIRLKVKTPSGEVRSLDEVGSGISYVLPILTSLWASDTSFIEQPELHLHPAAQCELGDVFIAATYQGKSCVVESHSEHLLLRILRRIRETEAGKAIPSELHFRPEQLRVYYFHPDGKGSTQVINIRMDHRGELLTEWPGGFFSERDRELFS
jgi:hypothetical protein